jgi:transcriptional regulator with XRE-family HTH domain
MTYTKIMTHNELKKWREKKGYSQSELAKALGTHVMTVSQWERNIRTIPTFLHLALRCLELEGGELKKGKTKKERRTKL